VQFPLFIKLHRSLLFSALILLLHALAALGGLLTPWPWAIRLALLACLGVSGLLAWRQLAQLPGGLQLYSDGRLAIERDGSLHPATLRPGGLALPGLCVLRFREEGGGGDRVLVLPVDAAAPEALRRLRVWLRCCSRSGAGS